MKKKSVDGVRYHSADKTFSLEVTPTSIFLCSRSDSYYKLTKNMKKVLVGFQYYSAVQHNLTPEQTPCKLRV